MNTTETMNTTNRTEDLEAMLAQLTDEEKLETLLFCRYVKENPAEEFTPSGIAALRAYYTEHGYFPNQGEMTLAALFH